MILKMDGNKLKKKVLIVCPYLNAGNGGVASYFNAIKNNFSYNVEFFFVGSNSENEPLSKKPFNLIRDIIFFFIRLSKKHRSYELIHFNPSLLKRSILRDGILLIIAKIFKIPTIIFFRGWNVSFAQRLYMRYASLFFLIYNNTDAFIALSSQFRLTLRKWGFNQPIYLETTTADDSLLSGYKQENRKIPLMENGEVINLLFLSRITKEKGIFITLETVKILLSKQYTIKLTVAGTGPALLTAKSLAFHLGIIDNVNFTGHVKGDKKRKIFEQGDILILPTYHGEGMPNSILEAMAFGMPVITRPVGGIKDIFQDGKFGYLTESQNALVMASLVEKIITDRDRWRLMSNQAFVYARLNFSASVVTKRLESIYRRVIDARR